MGTEGMNPKIADIQFFVNTTSCKFMAECKRLEGKDGKGDFSCSKHNNTIFVVKIELLHVTNTSKHNFQRILDVVLLSL